MKKNMLNFANKIKLSITPSIACIQQRNNKSPNLLPTLTKKSIGKRKLSMRTKEKENIPLNGQQDEKMVKTFTNMPKMTLRINPPAGSNVIRHTSNVINTSKFQQEEDNKNEPTFRQKIGLYQNVLQIIEILIKRSAIVKSYLTNYTVKKDILATILHQLLRCTDSMHTSNSQLSHQLSQLHPQINEKFIELGLMLSSFRFQCKKRKLHLSQSVVDQKFTHSDYAKELSTQRSELQHTLSHKTEVAAEILELENERDILISLNKEKEVEFQATVRQVNNTIAVVERQTLKVQKLKQQQTKLLQHLQNIQSELFKIDNYVCQNHNSILLASDDYKKCERQLIQYSLNQRRNEEQLLKKQAKQESSEDRTSKQDNEVGLLIKSWAESWTQKNQFVLGLKREFVFHTASIKQYLKILESKLECHKSFKELSVVLSIKECLHKLEQNSKFIHSFSWIAEHRA